MAWGTPPSEPGWWTERCDTCRETHTARNRRDAERSAANCCR